MTTRSAIDERHARADMVRHGASLFNRGLTAGSSGNISVRLDEGWLITPTNSSLGRLDADRISKLDRAGRHVSGDAPSKEAVLHRAIYEERPDAGAIVHLHATHSAAVSCLCGLDPANCIPPLTAYFVMKVGRLPLVPYHRPGDPYLGDAIRGLARTHSSVLLANHGPVVSGIDLDAAMNAIEELEETAKIFLLLRGSQTSPLDDAQIDELRRVFKLDLPPPSAS